MALEMLDVPLKMDGNPLNDLVAQINTMVEKAGGLMQFVEYPPCSDLDALRQEVPFAPLLPFFLFLFYFISKNIIALL